MKNIFLHGLVQNSESWTETLEYLEHKSENVCLELPELTDNEVSYPALYKGFSDYCEKISERINLCGLSLGGILALNYAAEHPDKVNSLVLIGTQYKTPKVLLRFQNLIFRFMPSSSFENIEFGKADFIGLSKSMVNLDLSEELERITCHAMVIVGENDAPNRKAAEEMSKKIFGCKLEVIENSGHEVNVDSPKQLAGLLNVFWRQSGGQNAKPESIHRV